MLCGAVYMNVCMHVCMHVCLHVCMHVCGCVLVCECVFMRACVSECIPHLHNGNVVFVYGAGSSRRGWQPRARPRHLLT